jgi:diguanylate cyclase (GGDEF)-like protein/PAS domain S-box-containing protein
MARLYPSRSQIAPFSSTGSAICDRGYYIKEKTLSLNLNPWISVNELYKQEEDRRMARILFIMILVYLAVSLIVLIMDQVWGRGSLALFLIIGAILQFFPLAALFKGKLSASSYAAMTIYIGLTTLFATTGQGIHDYVIMIYPAIMMFAGLTNQRRGLIISTLLVLVSLVWLILGEMNGWFVVQKTFVPNLLDMVAAPLLIITAALAVHLLVSNLEHGLAQTWHELANRKRMEKELRESHEDFKRYFNMGTVGMAVTSPQKGWVEVNDRLCQIFGYSKEELTQLTWSELTHPDDLETNLRLFDQLLAGEIDSYQLDKRYIRKDKSVVYTSISATCNRNSDGTVHHLLTSVIDITERKHNETIFQVRLELLEFAAAHSLDEVMQRALDEITLFTDSAIGFYHFVEPDQKTLSLQTWSTRTLQEFCKIEGKGMHYKIDKAGIWVDCIKQGMPVIHNNYPALPASRRKGLPEGHAEVTRELVVPVYRAGKVVSILGVGNKPTDYTEKDVESVSYLADITWEIIERKKTEQILHEIQSRLNLLSDNLEDAALYVYSHDTQGQTHFEYLSAGMEKLTGVKIEDALQNAASLHATILPEYLSRLEEAEAKSKEDLSSFEMEICQNHTVSDETRWTLLRSTPRRRADGSTVWYGVQMDITERKRNEKLLEEANEQLRLHVKEIEQLHEELREQAIRDPLTGLYNRRYMQDVFKQEFSRARRENYPVSVIMLDMDELKIINDTHGHHVGDRALQTLAIQLQSMTRKEDIVCRYGGDEFTVILSKTFPKDAVKRVEEWRESLHNQPMEIEGKNSVTVKFTAGIASFPTHGSSMEEIINYADVALYRAKARGRDCTVVFV